MKKNTKKLISLFMLIIIAAAFVVGCTKNETNDSTGDNTEKNELTKVVVSEFRSTNYAPVHVAYLNGYFEEEGLNVEFAVYGDGPVAFQGMHAGDSQFCMLSIDPVLKAFDQGLESTVVAAVDTIRLYGFVGSKDITDLSQLKGKSIFAGAPGSAPYTFVWSILENAGLDPEKDVTFVQTQYGASISALNQGTIDASYMDNANRNRFKEIGANFLVDCADPETRKEIFGSDRYEASIITTTKKYAQENPEIIQKFVNATVRGCEWIQNHSDEEVAELLAPMYDGTPMETLIEQIQLTRIAYSPDGFITEEGYAAMEGFCLKAGIIENPVGYENIIDMSFVEKAKQN